MTALDEYALAAETATNLSDRYPLIALAEKWSAKDAPAALKIVDEMDREADKARALRTISLAAQDDDLFERALAMALASRVRGNSLAPALASLALGLEYMDADPDKANQAFAQAYDIAWRMMIKYE